MKRDCRKAALFCLPERRTIYFWKIKFEEEKLDDRLILQQKLETLLNNYVYSFQKK